MAPKIILITGGNRGIGFGIVQSIMRKSGEHTVIITARKKDDAEKAVAELKNKGFNLPCHALGLDITNDDSIRAAVAEIDQQFGRLDVLINNAGIAALEKDPEDLRATWNQILDTNVTSVRITTALFLPLLRKSSDPRVINISSARGSLDRLLTGPTPKIASLPYSSSKACLNFTTLLVAREIPDVTFYVVSPGHCKTALNGYIGLKDPVDGGKAAAELAVAVKGTYEGTTFWEDEGKGMKEVGW